VTGRRDAPAGLRIRDAVADDLARIVELLRLGALGGDPGGPERPEDLGRYRDALRAIDESGDAVLVAELDAEVIGFCQLIVFRHLQHGGGRCAEIESVHVHPARRGQGIGGVLMEAAIERARGLGCYRVQLTSNAQRTDAHRFYERLGFVPSHVGFKLSLR
jgi:GNAT superfamily N-acetyltransferase